MKRPTWVYCGLVGACALAAATLHAQGVWQSKAPIPTARNAVASGVLGGRIHVMGGSGFTTLHESYDPATDTWSPRAPMPTGRTFSGTNGAVLNGKLYVVGGNPPGTCTSANHVYDPATNSWQALASMPTPRCHLAVAALDGLIYAIGGTPTSGAIKYARVEVYNPATNSWSTRAPMLTGRQSLGAAVHGGKLYAVGGWAGPIGANQSETLNAEGFIGTVEVYDPATNTWSPRATMPTPRSDVATAFLDGLLHAVGGHRDSTFYDVHEVYDPATDTWSTDTPMPTARTALGIGVVNSVLYAVAGSNASGAVPVNEAYTAQAPNQPPVADAGPDQTVEATSSSGATATLDGTGSSDPDGDALSYLWTGPFGSAEGAVVSVEFPMGTSTATLHVDDGEAVATDDVQVTVQDTTPPVIGDAAVTPAVLWPPNHRMVDVTVAYDAGDASCSLAVSSSEPVSGAGSGDTAPDWMVVDAHHVQLRAERAGGGSGRTYTITVGCTDAAGNTATRTVAVTVPNSRK